ncbi:netrin receptor dcc [Plakobranchus ocellatus]|uniref:Netrin receptor dcc n=1 Tax=Plakobranchus ocellatus TaxID=259542 RepID=A0AAV4C429_9GAST|nr:netrin receptor dcc [Plakobranchus ocellatus]
MTEGQREDNEMHMLERINLCMMAGKITVETEPGDRKLFVLEGEEQKLVCKATFPNRGDTVFWQFPHQEPPNTTQKVSNTEFVDGRYKKTLEITFLKFSSHDDGTYVCTYTPYGDSSPTYTSSIELSSVTAQRSDIAYNVGIESITLYCIFNLKDAKFSQWLKNNKALEKGDKYDILEGNHSLVIKELDLDDAGAYVARYNVDYKSLDCVVDYTAGPLVLDMGEFIDVVEDDTVNIDCDVKGWPTPEVEWWFNDEKKLEASSVVSFEEYKRVKGARLVLTGVTFDYDGIYECRAYSAQFNETSKRSIKLRVKDLSTKDMPVWMRLLVGVTVFIIGFLLILALILKKIETKMSRPCFNASYKIVKKLEI